MRFPAVIALALAFSAGSAQGFDKAAVPQPAALAGVEAVYVAPVALDLPEAGNRYDRRGDKPRAVLPRDAEAQAERLHAALRRGFDRDFTLADAPGAGVLVVEATLIGLASSRPTMADLQREPGISFESVYAGGASLRVRMHRDGRDVAMIEDQYVGTFADGQPRIGIWQDADRAYSMWSRQLPSFVEQPRTAGR